MKTTRTLNAELRKALHELLDKPEAFKKWLSEQEDDRLFDTGEMCGCPLWNFLEDMLPSKAELPKVLEVDCEEIRWRFSGAAMVQRQYLPSWASEFSTLDGAEANRGIKAINRDYAETLLSEVLE